MSTPDSNGFLNCTGQVVGGHAYLLMGFSNRRQAFRITNSWGRDWGDWGRAWLRYEDAAALLRQGEACAAIEKQV